MRSLIALLLLLAACAPSSKREAPPPRTPEQALMDDIEAVVRLPDGARPLNAYGRFYTYTAPGKVRAVYLRPSPPLDPNGGCDVMTDDLKSRPCTPAEIDVNEPTT